MLNHFCFTRLVIVRDKINIVPQEKNLISRESKPRDLVLGES